MKQLCLLFAYNANGDIFNAVTDFVHKLVSPTTYHCSLCKLTYGNMTMKQQWKKFLQTLSADTIFLHKDEFKKQFAEPFPLPAIFYLKGTKPIVLVAAFEINQCQTLLQLQEILLIKMKMLQTAPE